VKLLELEPQFVRYVKEADGEYLHHVDSLAQAQGIQFLCPSCFVRNKGPIGTHLIEVALAGRGVSDSQGSHNRRGKPSRWTAVGSGYGDLTLTPSVLTDPAKPACDGWHGYITNGATR